MTVEQAPPPVRRNWLIAEMAALYLLGPLAMCALVDGARLCC